MSFNYASVAAKLTTSSQTLYSVPSNVDVGIVQFGVCNNIGASASLTLWVVPFGGTAINDNQFITALPVLTASPYPMDAITGMVLESGESIVAKASDVDRLNVRISVLEVTNA